MPSPVQARIASVSGEGVLAPSGLPAFVRMFSSDESRNAFAEFSRSPVATILVSALRDMALNHHPPVPTAESCAVQYGLTQGLGLAAQLIEDPSVVFPGLFAVKSAPAPVRPDFGSSPDSVIDNMIADE